MGNGIGVLMNMEFEEFIQNAVLVYKSQGASRKEKKLGLVVHSLWYEYCISLGFPFV